MWFIILGLASIVFGLFLPSLTDAFWTIGIAVFGIIAGIALVFYGLYQNYKLKVQREIRKVDNIETNSVRHNMSVDNVKPTDPYLEHLKEVKKEMLNSYYVKVEEAKSYMIRHSKPVTKVTVSAVGKADDYSFYSCPDESMGVNSKVEVSKDYQVNNNGREKEVFVVSVDGQEIGELSKTMINKIEEFVWDAETAGYSVDKIGKNSLSLNVYDPGKSGVPGHRKWKLPIVGINFEGREKNLHLTGSGICKLTPTTYEGEAAVRVEDALGSHIGWVPKNDAGEIKEKIENNEISAAFIQDIENKEGKTFANINLMIAFHPRK